MTRRLWFIAAAVAGACLPLAIAQTAAPQSEAPSAATSPVEILVAKREKEPIRKADLDMLLPLLEENAKAYAENRLEPHRLDLWLGKWAKYDADTADPLVETLNTAIRKYQKNNVVLLRIMNDLIAPLEHTGSWAPTPEMVRKALDVIQPVRAQQKWLDIPKADPKTLDKLKMPNVTDTKNVPPEVLLKKTADVQKVRDQKMKTEWPAITNNEQLWELDSRIFFLRLMLASEEEDKKLVQELVDAATMRSGMFGVNFNRIVSAVGNGTVKDARVKPYFLAIKGLYDGSAKRQTLDQEFVSKMNAAGIRDTRQIWRLIEALSAPGSKLTDDQKKDLATAKLDEAAWRKSFSEYPFGAGNTPLYTYLVVFRPDAESEFRRDQLNIRDTNRSLRSLASKCGETLPELPR
ncbi:MAG: hypothetical protein HZA50_15315 [Planctomycetes bacterium]|nr:hypothetical protein [Planctomycetota bacterium]